LVPVSIGALACFVTRSPPAIEEMGIVAVIAWAANFAVANRFVENLAIRECRDVIR